MKTTCLLGTVSHVSEAEVLLVPNAYAYESEPMVKATGFREYDMHDMFEAMNVALRTHPEVGAYNQTI